MQHLPGHHRHDDEQRKHIERGRRARQAALWRREASHQHHQRVGNAGHDDEDAQSAPALDQIGVPMPRCRHGRQHREQQGRGPLRAERERCQHRRAASHHRTVQAAQAGHRQPRHAMHRPQRKVVIEQRLHEDPEQHCVADRHRHQRRLPQARHQRFEQRRGTEHLHAQAERQRHASPGRGKARAVAPEHAGQQQQQQQQQQQCDQRTAQRGVDEGQRQGFGHPGRRCGESAAR